MRSVVFSARGVHYLSIADAAKELKIARSTLMSWLPQLPSVDVFRDERKRWYLAEGLVRTLAKNKIARAEIARRSFATRSRELAKLQKDVEEMRAHGIAMRGEIRELREALESLGGLHMGLAKRVYAMEARVDRRS